MLQPRLVTLFLITLVTMVGFKSTQLALAAQATTQSADVQESAPEQTSAKSHTATINELVKTYHEYGQFNGTVLVAEKGEVILRQGYGMANMEWDIPNGPKTKFRIGSVTKQFTAVLILQLVEEGRVKLDEPITTYLTGYRKDTGDKVTVHDLLCHTSGIPSYTTPDFFANHSREPYELDEFISKFASGDLQFEPGAEFVYNNSGYHLLGAIIEKASGMTYAEALNERIISPLNMSDSGYDVSATILKNRAQGYAKTPDGFVNADYLDMGIPYSAGSMYSTVDDLYKWDRGLRDNKVLSRQSKKLMFTPNLRDYGYGVDIEDHQIGESDETTKVIHHGGGINGFNCLLSRVVDQNHVIVILDNVGMGNHHGDMTDSIINILNDQPFDRPKKSLADELHKSVKEKDGAAIVAQYRSLKDMHPDLYDFGSEQELNSLGYHLMSIDRVEDSIEVFKLNVEMFPEAFNPYDSLGEAYLKNGQDDLALKSYKKSVELNPENAGGVLAIKKLEGDTTSVDSAMLSSCIGKYELRPGFVVTITLEDGVLMAEPNGQDKVELEPVSDDNFFVPAIKGNVEFVRDGNGLATGMILKQRDQKIEGDKIE